MTFKSSLQKEIKHKQSELKTLQTAYNNLYGDIVADKQDKPTKPSVKKPKWTLEKVNKLGNLVRDGKTHKEIANILDMKVSQVTYQINKGKKAKSS